MTTTAPLTAYETVDALLSLRDRAAESLLIFALDEFGRSIPGKASLINHVPWGCSVSQRAIAFAWLSRLGSERVGIAFGHARGGATAMDHAWAKSAIAALELLGSQVDGVWVATRDTITDITPDLAYAA